MYDIGFVIGKFAPLHAGHINLINEAAARATRVVVVLSHDQKWVDTLSVRDKRMLTLKNKFRWLKQEFADIPHIEVVVLDENELPSYPNGWVEWANKLRKDVIEPEFAGLEDQNMAIFSSEPEYTENYNKYLPEVDHVVIDADRVEIPVSATKVRSDLFKYWEYLPAPVRRDYSIKVVVMGMESVGKTSLVKSLAKQHRTSWVEEYGRTYCEQYLAGSELSLRSSDYATIAFRHKDLEFKAAETANKLTFIDTNAFSTEFFHRLYEGEPNPVVSAIAAHENYDLVLVLSAEVPWVEDGLRINSDRSTTQKVWDSMVKEFPNQFPAGRTVYITGDSYESRLHQAKEAVTNMLRNINQGNY